MNTTPPNREPNPAHSPTDQPSANANLLVPIPDSGVDREVELSPAQQQALECLFEGASVARAARQAGVGRQTIHRWLRDDISFKTMYDFWHSELQRSLHDRMAAIGDIAMDNIANAIRLKGNLRASEFVLKHLLAKKQKEQPLG